MSYTIKNILKLSLFLHSNYLNNQMTSLRQDCKERLKIAFDSVRAVSNTLTFILIVDNYGLKVLSNTIKMMELINYGITIVERLQLKRKRINNIEAVYLINPDSYERMLEDFPEDGPPQYKSVHILALSKISLFIMQKISQNASFAKRVKTVKQINFNFSLHSNNQVKICSYDEKSFQKSVVGNKQIIQATINQLCTIVTSLSAFYIVQIYYQKDSVSGSTEAIALGLKQKFQSYFKIYEKFGIQNYTNSAPMTTFVILDRSYDAVSPLVRDFHYLPLLYDLKDITYHKISDWGKEKKTFHLDSDDQILQKYKNAHISVALTGIPKQFQQFTQNHAAAKFHKNQGEGELKMKQLGQVLKTMPQYMDIKDRFSLHYEALQQILGNMESQQLKNQGFVEQSILSLTSQDGKKIKQKDALSNLIAQLESTKDDQQKAKLVLIGLMCLQLKPKQQSSLTQFLLKTPFSGIEKNLNKLTGLNTYRLNSKKQNKGKQILDKHLPRIQETLRAISNQNHADLKHIRVGAVQKSAKPSPAKNQLNLGLKKIKAQTDKKDRPRMIVFVNSAIGYNQMRALSQFQNSYQMIYASHNFVTQGQYLRFIKRMGEEQEIQL